MSARKKVKVVPETLVRSAANKPLLVDQKECLFRGSFPARPEFSRENSDALHVDRLRRVSSDIHMTIEHINDRLIVKDQPLGFWTFYSIFVVGGMVALIFSLSNAPDRMMILFGSLIGIGNIAGGLYMIRREPASVVVFDRGVGEVRVCRWYPIGKREKAYPIYALSTAEVETTEHTDGGPVYRPRLRFGQLESVPVSMFWYQSMDKSEEVADEILRFLNLPSSKTDAGNSN
jgi:hypothetical protein